jgi:nucleotide-binding universal stress UspA family protein
MLVVDARPADAILASAQDEGTGLIVMSTHGRSGLSRLIMGSVAEEVLHRASVPVLLVRGDLSHPTASD